jgi:hypothetical protein
MIDDDGPFVRPVARPDGDCAGKNQNEAGRQGAGADDPLTRAIGSGFAEMSGRGGSRSERQRNVPSEFLIASRHLMKPGAMNRARSARRQGTSRGARYFSLEAGTVEVRAGRFAGNPFVRVFDRRSRRPGA